MVVNGDLDRIAAAAPVDRIVTAAGLSNGAYVTNFDVIFVRLGKNGFAYILRGADICLLCSVRLPVRSRGYHAANVQHIIRAGNALQNRIVFQEIAPDYF